MKKIINDTLKNHEGKFSRKSITTMMAFIAALIYEFVLPTLLDSVFGYNFETKSYVFNGLLTLTGSTLGLTVVDKMGILKGVKKDESAESQEEADKFI